MFPDMPGCSAASLPTASTTRARGVAERWTQSQPAICLWLRCLPSAAALHAQPGANQLDVSGLTGHLTLDAERRVHRELVWGTLHGGQPRALPAAAANN